MNFKIGDKVHFLNEKGEGTVSKIINKTTVGITIEDGFEIPFPISELILIYDKSKTEIPAKNPSRDSISSEEKPQQYQFPLEKGVRGIKEGIYVAFSPEKINDIPNSDINVWFINNTGYQLLYSYSLFQNGNFITLETGYAKAFESLLIETVDRKELSDFSTFKIEALFFDDKEHEHHSPISEIIKLKPIKLYKENSFLKNDFVSEKALIINVAHLSDFFEGADLLTSKIDLSKLLFQKKTQTDSTKKSKPNTSNDPSYEMEINLHIEELLDNYKGMSNAEIILVQLKHFQRALDTAISEHYRKLIVIHGVGNGRLKQEVRTLITSYKHLQYYDASYTKYGFGATEILIS
jgi:hypothetical protein